MDKILLAEDRVEVIHAMRLLFLTEFPDYKLEVVTNTPSLVERLRTTGYAMGIIDLHPSNADMKNVIKAIPGFYPNLAIFSDDLIQPVISDATSHHKPVSRNKCVNDDAVIYAFQQVLEWTRAYA